MASISGNTTFAALVVDQSSTGDLFTASKSGASKFTIKNNGDVQINNLTTNGGLVYTNGTGTVAQTSAGSLGQCLTSTGVSGAPTWTTCSAGANLWQENPGALAPSNITDDLLLGGTSTASAKFAFKGVAGGTPTASISGTTANTNTFLTGNGNLGTTNAQTLTLGGSSTGNVIVRPGDSTTAFQIQNANGTPLLSADTINSKIDLQGDLYSKGLVWTARSTNTNIWRSVTYGRGMFVAVSSTGTGNGVMTSSDGITWTNRTPAANNTWKWVTYGKGLFVAVGDSGSNRVMTSPDGINWTLRDAVSATSWRFVTYGNGLFVAFSHSGTDRIMTSPDGVTWTARSVPTGSGTNIYNTVVFANGKWVGVAHNGTTTNAAMTSSDGITWTAQTVTPDVQWRSVSYGNGLYVAVGDSGNIMTSPDGVTWTFRTSPNSNNWNAVTYGNGLFVAVSYSGSGNRVMTSPDGATWTARTSAVDNNWNSIVYANGMFVTTADTCGSSNCIMTSGKAEDYRPPTDNTILGGLTVYGNSLFKSDANSSTAFQIQNAAGNQLFNVGSIGTSSIASVSGNTSFAALVVDQSGSGDIFTASTSGATKFTILNNGDIKLAGGINVGGSVGTGSQCLLGGATAAWGSCSAATNQWNIASGTISPITASVLDLLIGGSATTSAKFAITGVNGSASPVASLSATTASGGTGSGLVLDSGNNSLQSLRNQTLTIGGTTTGNIVLSPLSGSGKVGIGTASPTDTLSVQGTAYVSSYLGVGVANPTNALQVSGSNAVFSSATGTFQTTISKNALADTASFLFKNNFSGRAEIGLIGDDKFHFKVSSDGSTFREAIVIDQTTGSVGFGTTNPLATLDVRGNSATTPAASLSANSTFAAAVIDQSGTGDIYTASKSGATKFTITNSGDIRVNNLNAPSCDVKADTTGLLFCGTDATGSGGTNFFNQVGGLTYLGNLTSDFAVGGLATNSAKFTVLNVIGAGTPTASISGTTANTNTFLTGNGNLGTTNAQTLTLGGASTGNITLSNDTIVAANKNLTLSSGTGVYSQTFTGTNTNGATITANSLNNGSALLVQGGYGYNNGLVTFKSTGNNGANSGSSLLNLDNGANASGIIALNISKSGGSTFSTDIQLQNTATIDNATNNQINLAATTVKVTGSNLTTSATTFNLINTVATALNIGGAATTLKLGAATGTTVINNSLTVGNGSTSPLATLDVRGNSGTTPVASVAGITAQAGLVVDNSGVGDIFTASKSGATKFAILNNGNIQANNYNTAGGVFYGQSNGTLGLSAAGTNGQCLTSGGAGAPGWSNCAASNFLTLNNGLLYASNTTTDFAIGGTATSGASTKFAFTNVNSGTPTAIFGGGEGATPTSAILRGGGAAGTNITGGNLTLAASNGTGTGGSGDLIFQTAAPNTIIEDGHSSTDGTFISGATNTITTPHTTGAYANRLLIVGVSLDRTTVSVSTITYNGVALTKLTAVNCSANCRNELWYLKAPATGSNNVVMNLSGNANFNILTSSFDNVDQSSTFGTAATNTGNSATGSVTATSSTTQLVIAHSASETDFGIDSTGQKSLSLGLTDPPGGNLSSLTGAATNTTLSWDFVFGGSQRWAAIGVALNPVANTTANTLIDRLRIKNNGDIYFNTSDQPLGQGAMRVDTLEGNLILGTLSSQIASTAARNTVLGISAGGVLTTGTNNTAVGASALSGTSTGSSNTGVGYDALTANSTGVSNTAVGVSALGQNTTGNFNIAMGDSALYNATGSNNTALGYKAGYGSNALGNINGNALLGYQAGVGLRTGADYNTILGYSAGSSLTTGARNILIGQGVQTTAATSSDRLNIGNTIYGNLATGTIGIGASTPLATLDIRGNSGTTPVASVAGITSKAALLVDNSGSGDLFTASKSGATKFVIANNGNVGIGTAVPLNKLGIAGNVAIGSYAGVNTAPTNGLIVSGNVGIGTATPATELQVAGTITVNGDVLANAAPTAGATSQTITAADSTNNVGQYTSIKIGSDGFPVIAHYDVTNTSLRVTKCSNASCSSSSSNVIDGATGCPTGCSTSASAGQYAKMAISNDGFPIISYYDSGSGDLKVVKCGNTSCTSGNTYTSIDTSIDSGQYNSIVIATDGNPLISYYDNTNKDLKYARCTTASCSSSTLSTLDNTGTDEGKYSSIVLGQNDAPVIAYYEGGTCNTTSNCNPKVAYCDDLTCTTAILTRVDNNGSATDDYGLYVSIAIKYNGAPVLSYYDNTNQQLRSTNCYNIYCTSWVGEAVDTASANTGQYTSIMATRDGLPIITSYDFTNGDLRVATCGQTETDHTDSLGVCSNRNVHTIESTNNVGQYTSIVLGTDGFPTISYYDVTNGDLRVVKCADISCFSTSGGGYSGGSNIGSVSQYFNNVYANTYWGKNFQVAAFDVAEEYNVTDTSITPGDVVRVRANQLGTDSEGRGGRC